LRSIAIACPPLCLRHHLAGSPARAAASLASFSAFFLASAAYGRCRAATQHRGAWQATAAAVALNSGMAPAGGEDEGITRTRAAGNRTDEENQHRKIMAASNNNQWHQ